MRLDFIDHKYSEKLKALEIDKMCSESERRINDALENLFDEQPECDYDDVDVVDRGPSPLATSGLQLTKSR